MKTSPKGKLPRLWEIEEGDRCPFYGCDCKGIMEVEQETCTCHLGYPPCGYCTSAGLKCNDNRCGYEITSKEMETDQTIISAKMEFFMGLEFKNIPDEAAKVEEDWKIIPIPIKREYGDLPPTYSSYGETILPKGQKPHRLLSGLFEPGEQLCQIFVVPDYYSAERLRLHFRNVYGRSVKTYILNYSSDVKQRDFRNPKYSNTIFIATEPMIAPLSLQGVKFDIYTKEDSIWRNI